MSTTFGIYSPDEDCPVVLHENGDPDWSVHEKYEFIKVAFRNNHGTMRWTNPLGSFLPDYLPVYALDNSNQGIKTIKDVKREIESQP